MALVEATLHVPHGVTHVVEERLADPLLPHTDEHLVGVLETAVQRTRGEVGGLGHSRRSQVVEAVTVGFGHHRVEQLLGVA